MADVMYCVYIICICIDLDSIGLVVGDYRWWWRSVGNSEYWWKRHVIEWWWWRE